MQWRAEWGEQGDSLRHPRKGRIQRMKLKKSYVVNRWFLIVRLLTHVACSFFSLRHFVHFCRDILVIRLTVVLKIAVIVFFSLSCKHSDRKDLISFGHFKFILVYDQNMTKKNSFHVFNFSKLVFFVSNSFYVFKYQ